MPQAPLPEYKIRKLLQRCFADNFNKTQTASQLRIARSSATQYVNAFKRSALTLSDIELVRRVDFLLPCYFQILNFQLQHTERSSCLLVLRRFTRG